MKGHLIWIAVWLAVLFAGYLLSERLIAPPPVVRSLSENQKEIVVPVARDGHYYLDGSLNGVPLRFMVDTGASYVSVSARFARSAGIEGGIPSQFQTANGVVQGRVAKHQAVGADAFEVSGLSVAVMPGQSDYGLLGQNFLRHFDVSQSDGMLRLRLRPAAPN